MKPISTPNREAHRHVTTRALFKGTNLYSANIGYLYAVFSYAQTHPLYVYAKGVWYENSDKSTQTTERHRRDARPDGVQTVLKTTVELRTMLHEALQPASAAAQPSPTAQTTKNVPAIQGETNVQLDTDSDPTAPGQQWNVAGAVALGQPVGDGQHEAGRHTQAQGDKLLTVAERNLRRFLETAVFRDEADRQAALNCLEVLTAPAPAQPWQEGELPSWWPDFIKGVCEIPDRSSPEGEPEAIIATPEELAACALSAIDSDRAASATEDSVTAPAGGVDDDVDAIALARYKVVPAHESMFYRFAVVAGDGKQQLYLGREVECENMARKFAGAFLDGAFYQSHIATTPPAQAHATSQASGG